MLRRGENRLRRGENRVEQRRRVMYLGLKREKKRVVRKKEHI